MHSNTNSPKSQTEMYRTQQQIQFKIPLKFHDVFLGVQAYLHVSHWFIQFTNLQNIKQKLANDISNMQQELTSDPAFV